MNTVDQSVYIFFQSIHNPFFDRAFYIASWIFNPIPFMFLFIFSLVVLYKWKGLKTASFMFFAVASAFVVAWSLKYTFNISRPLHSGILVFGSSFPSGHSAVATSYFAVLFYFCQFSKERFRRYVHVLFCILCPLFVGVSRLYLGVHWLSDVLGGFIVGGVCVYVCFRLIIKRTVNI